MVTVGYGMVGCEREVGGGAKRLGGLEEETKAVLGEGTLSPRLVSILVPIVSLHRVTVGVCRGGTHSSDK